MNSNSPLALLGGLSPSQFMKRHWQKKPLVVRQAVPGFQSPLKVNDLKRLAADPDVESRLIVKGGKDWQMHHGPLARKAFPPAASGNGRFWFRVSICTMIASAISCASSVLYPMPDSMTS